MANDLGLMGIVTLEPIIAVIIGVFWLGSFVVIISMSFMMICYTLKSKGLWPAVIFHAVSNV